ncbi:TPA: putative phage tail assembly chaperone [Salmonella enterica subsp. salamae serovar 16:m,t:e,n,x]|nr:putative phage tail assembly chaperone [Salmonella enterica subsp. salamae serovar 16:m,t:e,n,x]
MEETITLTIGGVDIVFEPNEVAYNSYINEMAMDNKIAPSIEYVRAIVSRDSKDALAAILKKPGAAIQIAAAVNKQYAPELDIVVKK